MQHFKKIKQLNQRKKEKEYALTSLQIKRKTMSKQLNRQSSIESDPPYFVIKNLDKNELEVYQTEEKLEKDLLEQVDELPQIEKLLESIWEKYMNDYDKQQEQFLEACYQGEVKTVKRVLSSQNKHPIDIKKALTDEGKNGIHLATISGSLRNVDIIRALVEAGVDINGTTHQEERTPLMLGSILGNEVAVRELLKLGAKPICKDFEGNTAAHHAIQYNQENVAKILIEARCPKYIKNQKGQSVMDLCSPKLLAYIKEIEVGQEAEEAEMRLSRFETLDKQDVETQMGLSNCQKVQQVAIREVGLSCFKKLLMLGRGAFGEVYLAQNTLDSKRYAVKVLDKGSIMRQNILRYAMTERKILSAINHPFVVRLQFAFQTPQKLYLVMDYCPGGDLLALIKRTGVLSEDQLKKYMAEITLAIEALHRAEIIYRDLKPSNIILDSEGHACLTDFGLSKEASLSHSFCGSTAYLAPQMLWRRGHTKVLDWYLLGVVIYECLTGRPPFWDSNKEQLLANIKSGRYKPLSQDFSREVRDLVQKLLRSNSSKRLGVNGSKQIKAHPWFSDLDWQVVEARGLKMTEVQEVKGKPVKQQLFQDVEMNQSHRVKGWDFIPGRET